MSDRGQDTAAASSLPMCQKCRRPRRRRSYNSNRNYCTCDREERSLKTDYHAASNSSRQHEPSENDSCFPFEVNPSTTSRLSTEGIGATVREDQLELLSFSSSTSSQLMAFASQLRVPPILLPFIPPETRSNSPVPTEHSMPVLCYGVLFKRGTFNGQHQTWILYFFPYDERAYTQVSDSVHKGIEGPKNGQPWPWTTAQGDVPEGNKDHFRWRIEVRGDYFTIGLHVDPGKCILRILSQKCHVDRDELYNQHVQQLRLFSHNPPSLEFELVSANGQSQETTLATICRVMITTNAGETSYKEFAAYFSCRPAPSTVLAEMPARDREILRNSHRTIGELLNDIDGICRNLHHNDVLDGLDMYNILNSEEPIGELLSKLQHRGDVLDCFIAALCESEHENSKDLAKLLSNKKNGNS